MAFTDAVVDAYIAQLKELIPNELGIADYFNSEQSLRSIQKFPIIFVLCPNWNAEYMVEEGFPDTLDVTYDLIFGTIVKEQDTKRIKPRLYEVIDEIVKSLLASEHADFDYTLLRRGTFRARFGPILANQETFISDAQIQVMVKKRVAESFE